MINNDNSCAHLNVEDLYSENNNHLDILFETQMFSQTKIYGYDYENMNLGQLCDYWNMNTHALMDEVHEMYDALGGKKYGNAVWKPWKKQYEESRNIKLNDLTEEDRKELFMEYIDILHFIINYGISLGLTSKDVFNLFMAKTKENRDRQTRGY